MKTIVLYSSKSGNTGKIADEIASELHCESVCVARTGLADSVDLDSCDLIVVGTGIHFGSPNEDLVGYLKTISLKEPKVFAVFVTWGGAGKTNQDVIAKLKMILESKGQRVVEDSFFCFCGWNFLRRGHPNGADAMAARAWARKIVNGMH